MLTAIAMAAAVYAQPTGVPTTHSPAATEAGTRTNFLVILCDDLGYGDLACYGHPMIQTPRLDQLATEGIRLTSCYSAAPVCSPSRCGLLTGRNPYRYGIYSHIPEEHPMHLGRNEITIAQLLQQAGYATGQFGKWHCNGWFNSSRQPQPHEQGFDYWFSTPNNAQPSHEKPHNFVRNGTPVGPTEKYSCHVVVDETIDWLRNHRPADQPFFAYVCFHETHERVASPPNLVTQYPQAANENQAIYFANVTNVDRAVTRLLDALDNLGEAENTLVLFSSDNGPAALDSYGGSGVHCYGSPGPLRGMKLHLYDGGIRVPGIIRWPAHVTPGQVIDEPVCSLDLLPTFCAIAGIAPPADRPLDGVNILPILSGQAVERTTPLFWLYYFAASNPKVAMREGNWKMVAHWDIQGGLGGVTPESIGAAKQATLTDLELYNLQQDISEQNDRASQEPERTQAMIDKIQTLFAEIQAEGPIWPAQTLAHVWGDQFSNSSAWTAADGYAKLNFISGVTRVDDGTGSVKQPAGEARFMYRQLANRPFHTCQAWAYARELEFGYSGSCDMKFRSMLHLRDPSGSVADARIALGYAASADPADFFCQAYGRRNLDGLNDTGLGSLGTRNEAGDCWADKWVQFRITVNHEDIEFWSSNAGATDREYQYNGQNVVRPSALTSSGVGRIYLGQTGQTADDIWWDSVQVYGFIPGQPMNMAGIATSISQVTWKADPYNTDHFGFEVFDEASSQSLHVTSTTTRTATLNWTETGLLPNTSYSRYATAWNGSLNGPQSGAASVYTRIETPIGLQVGEITASTIDVFPEGTLSNLDAGQSGVRITNLTTGVDTGFQQHAGGATFDGLAPNTAYSFVARARNGDGIETADSSPVNRYTLSIPPYEESVQLTTSPPCPGSDVSFIACDGFGSGYVAYYRYAWNQNPTHEFLGAEAQWSSGSLSLPVVAAGSWYLHVQGFNGEDIDNGTFDYPVEIPDTDLDGVPDCLDNCPGTIPGAPVDGVGCPPLVHGDLDRDGDVDAEDLMKFMICVTGPAILHDGSANCQHLDIDSDGDVDQSDFGAFQRCFSGADLPADPTCSPSHVGNREVDW